MSPESFEVSAEDGHRFRATLYRAAVAQAPLLLFMPAMGTRARYYAGFGAAMSALGVHLACCDWRGIDSSSLRAARDTDFGYRHLVELDLPAAIAELRARVPQANVFLGGHSLGGQLAAMHAGRDPQGLAGLVFIAAGSVYWRGWSGWRAYALFAFAQSTVPISALVGYFPGPRFRFGGREARGVMRDWARVGRSGTYRAAGSTVDYEAGMARAQLPVFALSFESDVLAPRASMERLLGKLPRSARQHLHWDEADSGGAALDHFSWAKRADLVAPALSAWLHEVAIP